VNAAWATLGRGEPRGPWIQPTREFLENKSKQMKAEWLSFIFIYFSESGLFNGLRSKK